ncbi:hypothetical protein DF047_17060 [Burkholderia cenocepacia]|uniref:hypothetical protein n=1 Tax=Burkholderia cenocepacia TaxID=95486 RepID=UPI000F5BB177|nr:hypothetical protein [Burkholderia cenocepacia]RQV06928.1 hypothetical protein DF047_17060 [Burkholderia cenocepacia]
MSSNTHTTANMPNPSAPMTGQDGRLVPEWTALILALLARTGGEGTPIDIVSLQAQVNAQGKQIDELFLLENSSATGALLAAVLRRLVALELSSQSVVPIQPRAAQTLPDLVATPLRTATNLPEPVAVPQRVSDDLRKLIEA